MPLARALRPDHTGEIRRALVDPRALCERLGLLGDRRGRDFLVQPRGVTIRCPAHQEHTPSCSVTIAQDGLLRVHCFGCDFSGDVFTLIAQARGLHVKRDFPRVLRDAAELGGLWNVVSELDAHAGDPDRRPLASSRSAPTARSKAEPPTRPVTPRASEPTARRTPPARALPSGGGSPERTSQRPDVPPLDADTFDRIASALLEACPLDRQPDVRAYLDDRKLLDLAREAGWAALPADPRPLVAELARAFGDEVLERAGLVTLRPEGLALAWSDHRLVIPWREHGTAGAVVTLQRRLVRPPRSPREQKYVFPRGRRPEQPFAVAGDVEELGAGSALAFVEGAVDTLALRWLARREGLDVFVLGLAGVSDWRPTWATLAAGRVVYLALDADRAGEHAIATIRGDLYRARAIKRWRPKTGKDWAEHLALVRIPTP